MRLRHSSSHVQSIWSVDCRVESYHFLHCQCFWKEIKGMMLYLYWWSVLGHTRHWNVAVPDSIFLVNTEGNEHATTVSSHIHYLSNHVEEHARKIKTSNSLIRSQHNYFLIHFKIQQSLICFIISPRSVSIRFNICVHLLERIFSASKTVYTAPRTIRCCQETRPAHVWSRDPRASLVRREELLVEPDFGAISDEKRRELLPVVLHSHLYFKVMSCGCSSSSSNSCSVRSSNIV